MQRKDPASWRGEAHRVLPRYFDRNRRVEAVRRAPAAVAVAAEPAAPSFKGDALLVDQQRLRGIPAIGRGVSGAIASTDPFRGAVERARRRGELDE